MAAKSRASTQFYLFDTYFAFFVVVVVFNDNTVVAADADVVR